MDYLAETRVDRQDPERLLPGCRAVVAVALAYGPREDDPSWAPVSRYAAAPTITSSSGARLTRAAAYPREAGGQAVRQPGRRGHRRGAGTRLRRPGRAGLVRQEHHADQHAGGSSYFFLGALLLDLGARRPTRPLEPTTAAPARACLDACPTGAFVAPRRARRARVHQLPDHRAARRDPRRAAEPASATGSSAATSARRCARGTARRRPRASRRWRPRRRWRARPAKLLALDEAASARASRARACTAAKRARPAAQRGAGAGQRRRPRRRAGAAAGAGRPRRGRPPGRRLGPHALRGLKARQHRGRVSRSLCNRHCHGGTLVAPNPFDDTGRIVACGNVGKEPAMAAPR